MPPENDDNSHEAIPQILDQQQLDQLNSQAEDQLKAEHSLRAEEALNQTITDVLEGFTKEHVEFHQDISKDLPEEVLNRIANYLEDRILADAKYQENWISSINLIKPYLGLFLNNILGTKSETDLLGTLTSKNIYDNTFATALLRLWATIRSEILPTEGPVGFKTIMNDTETGDILGNIVKDAMNEYLTVEDKGFYPDFDRFLLYLLLYGCIFRKVFIHPISKKPVTRFILPEDFLIENNCSSSFESGRQTHIRYLDKQEILSNLRNGIFRSNVELNYLKNNLSGIGSEYYDSSLSQSAGNSSANFTNLNGSSTEKEPTSLLQNNNNYKFYETYEYLDISSFMSANTSNTDYQNSKPPVPYIITRCATTNKIVSLIPNWKPEDETKKKIEHFVHYNLFPGFDIYGLGLGQILGSNAVTLTEIQRISIDSAIFQIFPGGIRVEGIKVQDNNLSIKPGQFVPLDTGTIPLQQAIMPLPYNGPSPVLMELANNIKNSSNDLASIAEIGLSQESAQTPVGTTVAMLEVANRMQSAILKTIHNSFSDEIELLFSTFYAQEELNKFKGFKVIPVSDPSVESSTMRIMKAENLLKIAGSAPELHDMRAVYERLYTALGIGDIDSILKQNNKEQTDTEQPIDTALQIQMADTEQRRLEVESRERIAMLNMENAGYQNQMQIELDKMKLQNDKYIADLKAQITQDFDMKKLDLEKAKFELEKEKIQLDKSKLESEGYKTQMNIELQKSKLKESSSLEEVKLELALLKDEKNVKIKELEDVIEELKLQLTEQPSFNLITEEIHE